MEKNKIQLRDWLKKPETIKKLDGGQPLGLSLGPNAVYSIPRDSDGHAAFEIHSLRPCTRIGPDGQERLDILVAIVQRRMAFFDKERQENLERKVKAGNVKWHTVQPDYFFCGGATVIIDPSTGEVRFTIRKRVDDNNRLEEERAFRLDAAIAADQSIYFDAPYDNPFARLHMATKEWRPKNGVPNDDR
jgi:hypothetical protein